MTRGDSWACSACSERELAEEDHQRLTGHVEGGERGGDHDDPEDAAMMLPRTGHDQILGVVAAEEEATRERQHAAEVSQEGDGHLFPEAAHLPDVLLVVHSKNDRTGREEEEALEEGVREEVEHRQGRRDGETGAGHHVAELGNRGVGEDPLDVILLGREDAGSERGDRTGPGNDLAGVGRG